MADYTSQFTGAQIDARLAQVSTNASDIDALETNVSSLQTSVSGKQATLVSGTNIKTINGSSILGSGDLEVTAGTEDAVQYVAQTLTDAQKAQARTNIGAASTSDLSALTDANYVVAWDGSAAPTVANIPAGVVVTYSSTSYTGTLTASADTAGNIYLVHNGSNYDMYISTYDGSNYSWVGIGDTNLDLSGYATDEELSQLSLEVDDIFPDNNFGADLVIQDELGYTLAAFEDGEFRTKEFDSSKVKVETGESSSADFVIQDENELNIVEFSGGHIKTKNFDSSTYGKTQWYGKNWMGFGTSITNTSNEGKYPTYLASLSGMVFNNHGHSGGGITQDSNESIYNDVMSATLTGMDLITLEVGANDGSAPLGTIYDGLPGSTVLDNSTFCGALNLCIRHLQANSDAQVVVMCSPTSRYHLGDPSDPYYGNETFGSDNHTILERNEAIRKVCEINSCWFIPAGAMDGMGFARMNASNDYNTDQVHHTDLGGYNFAQAIWAFLKNIPLFHTSIN